MSISIRFERFCTAVNRTYKCIQKIKSHEMGNFLLRGSHTMYLYFLGKSDEGMTAMQLTAACGDDKAMTSRALAELEKEGLVVPDSRDEERRYRIRLKLTEKGKKVAEECGVIIDKVVEHADFGISDEELEVFYSVLDRIIGNLQSYMKMKGADEA